jgi:hypothetical protein
MNMNAIREMIVKSNRPQEIVKKPDLTLVKSKEADKEILLVDGRWVSKDYLNEKMAYFYENGGPVMDI